MLHACLMAPRTALGTLKSSPDFRVLSFQPQNGQILDRSYQRRLPHQKSREGCMACKIKRVKVKKENPISLFPYPPIKNRS